MADDPFHRDARRLVAVFARCLREERDTDPDILANALVQLARGHGWRPIDGLQPPVEPTDGTKASRLPEEVLARRAALETRPPCVCGAPVLEHQLENARRTGCPATGCTAYTPERSL